MPQKRIDIPIGAVFGRLTVVRARRRSQRHGLQWECLCACGNTTHALGGNLRKGNTKSCGCWRREHSHIQGLSRGTHGHKGGALRSHGGSRTYRSWRAMMQRCHDAKSPAFLDYGARGISVCRAWRENFLTFLNDMGERPVETSIDRIDPRFGYFAPNCRWASAKEQAANRQPRSHSRYPTADLARAQREVTHSRGGMQS